MRSRSHLVDQETYHPAPCRRRQKLLAACDIHQIPRCCDARIPSSYIFICRGHAPLRLGDFGEEGVKSLGRFVLYPMPGAGDHLEAGARLDAAQCASAVVEVGVGGCVTPAPDPVEPRRDEWKGTSERVPAREPAALDPAARRVLPLNIDRKL